MLLYSGATKENIQHYIDKEVFQEKSNELAAAIKESIEVKKAIVNKLETFFKPEKDFSSVTELNDSQLSLYEYTFIGQYVETSLVRDPSTLEKKLMMTPNSKVESPEHKEVVREYIAFSRPKMTSTLFMQFSKGLKTPDELLPLLKEKIQRYKKEIEKSDSILKPFLEDSLERISHLIDEPKFKNEHLNDVFIRFIVLEGSLEKKENPFYSPLTCPTDKCKEWIRTKLSKLNFKRSLARFKKKLTSSNFMDKTLGQCRPFILNESRLKISLAEQKEVQGKFKNLIEEYDKEIVQKLFQLKKSSFKSWALKNVKLYFSPKNQNLTSIEQIRGITSQDKLFLANFENQSLIDKKIYFINQLDPQFQLSERLFCSDFNLSFAGDVVDFLRIYDKKTGRITHQNPVINVSLLSVRNFDTYGRESLGHELSHVLSYYLYNYIENDPLLEEKYKKLRSCITSRHQKNQLLMKTAHQVYSGDSIFSEEDTADELTSFMHRKSPHLNTCLLLYNKKDRPVLYHQPGSEHSGVGMRILREAINKDFPLPRSCDNVIENHPDISFSSCFKSII